MIETLEQNEVAGIEGGRSLSLMWFLSCSLSGLALNGRENLLLSCYSGSHVAKATQTALELPASFRRRSAGYTYISAEHLG